MTLETDVGPGGTLARDLAIEMKLEPESIEGVFVNHQLYSLDRRIAPGDRVAFVPYGTPGPHRVYLGLYEAGRETRAADPGRTTSPSGAEGAEGETD